jgi:glycerol kinase
VQAGLLPGPEQAATHWRLDRRFQPLMAQEDALRKHAGWREAVQRTLTR